MSIASLLIGPIAGLLDKLIPDKDAREKMAHEIATLAADQAHEAMKLQMEVNKQEAAHPSIFVSGWRPFIGWTCGIAMAMNFLFAPILNMCLGIWEIMDKQDQLIQIPLIDLTIMMPVLLGMLGLGTMRTVEKMKGVARSR